MTIIINKRFYLLIPLLTLGLGCAKINAPTGGPKDKTPPVVEKSIPLNGARNFKGKKLVITFDEFVILDKINEKLMVSPPMSKKPNVYIRGKNLNVEFEDDLKDSTTYTINFQDAIRDLNEGNIIDNFQFVFSTGRVIDSLQVSGRVFNAFNLDVPENTLVLLYSNLADSAVKNQLPDYISRVDKYGSFLINNIREGKYRVYALKDIDNSKNYNVIEEEFGFMDAPIEVTPENNYFPVIKDTSTIKPAGTLISDTSLLTTRNTIILFTAQRTAHYLRSTDRNMPYNMIYSLSLPPDSMNFDFSIPGSGKGAFFIETSKNRDTIKIWLTDSSLYSQPQITTLIRYPFTDTTGALVYKEDTVKMRFVTPRQTRGQVKRKPLQVNKNISNGILKPGQQIVFTSQTPFNEPDTSLIRLYEAISEKKIKVPYLMVRDTSNACRYSMTARLAEGEKYLFIADSAAFGNIYGEYSDSTGIKFSVTEAKSYGELALNIKDVQSPVIIQLLDKTEKLIHEKYIKTSSKVEFPFLEKGSFRVRAIIDINGDGKWTTGDFTKGRQPEPVSYYPVEIEVRTDWKVENDWIPGTTNFKEQKLRDIKK